MLDDTALDRATACFPPADVTPAEFERFVVTLFAGLPVTVTLGEKILHQKVASVGGAPRGWHDRRALPANTRPHRSRFLGLQ